MKTVTFMLQTRMLLSLFIVVFWGRGAYPQAADSVDVTFYYLPKGNPAIVYLPGEFNDWGRPYVNNKIVRQDVAMQKDPETGVWWKTVRLRVGGHPGGGVPGAYQYKFNENGDRWLSDPRNPRQNPNDFNNSYLFITNPTIHYLLPNSLSEVVHTRRPEITAYVFPAVGSEVDAGSITVIIDDTTVYRNLGGGYDPATHFFSFRLPDPLSNGEHRLKLTARSTSGTVAADSTSFVVQAGVVQILTRSNPYHIRPTKTINGVVLDSTITRVTVLHNGTPVTIPVVAGRFSHTANLVEGENRFGAYGIDGNGQRHDADEIVIVYVVDHAPKPVIRVRYEDGRITFSATGNDPDGDAVTFAWTSEDERNPEPLGIQESRAEFSIDVPEKRGRYYLRLIARDPQANEGMARTYFEVHADGSVTTASRESNPSWVRDAVIYQIFLPAFGRDGTFRSARERLSRVKDLGANVIWLTPIYENGELINQTNAGYNITNFYKVHPQLGTIGDFRDFVAEAHRLGMRVILDITPNHVSENHPWVQDIKKFRDFSNYRPLIEARILGNDRGLGQYVTTVDGYPWYAHYSNWTLANLNYRNIETFDAMMRVFKHWILNEGIDGYRMDVYWGPQNRYGKDALWRPFRDEIKRVQPDILILGETDATGPGSEHNFADTGGASDAAYDWNFYNQVKEVLRGGSIYSLDNRVRNYSPNQYYNHFTGPNSHYFRFLENHDEDRLALLFGRERSFAAATLLFTVPGIPLIYAGQEVGEVSKRGRIQWNTSRAPIYYAHYKRLTSIRLSFAAFRTPKIKRISANHNRVYAFLRPHRDQNAIVAINFSSVPVEPVLSIAAEDLEFSSGGMDSSKTYYFNDVLNDTFYVVTRADLGNYAVPLPAWGAVVFILADSIMSRVTAVETAREAGAVPGRFALYPNYPNPFNPETRIVFEIPERGPVRLSIIDALGRVVTRLIDGELDRGRHEVFWRGITAAGQPAPSGVYFVHLRVPGRRAVQKILLVR